MLLWLYSTLDLRQRFHSHRRSDCVNVGAAALSLRQDDDILGHLAIEQVSDSANDQAVHHQGGGEGYEF
jgi:hypothetical protein